MNISGELLKKHAVTLLQIALHLALIVAAANYFARLEHGISHRQSYDLTSYITLTIILYLLVLVFYLRTGSTTFMIATLYGLFLAFDAYNLYQDQVGEMKHFSVGFSSGWQQLANHYFDKSKQLFHWLMVINVLNVICLLFIGKLRQANVRRSAGVSNAV